MLAPSICIVVSVVSRIKCSAHCSVNLVVAYFCVVFTFDTMTDQCSDILVCVQKVNELKSFLRMLARGGDCKDTAAEYAPAIRMTPGRSRSSDRGADASVGRAVGDGLHPAGTPRAFWRVVWCRRCSRPLEEALEASPTPRSRRRCWRAAE